MRFLIPAAALLLGGAAFLLRGEDVASPTRTALPCAAREAFPPTIVEATFVDGPKLPLPPAVRPAEASGA